MKQGEDMGLVIGFAVTILLAAVVLFILSGPQVRSGGNPVPCDNPRPEVCPQR